ncbi:HpaII family restriction endonuclease [Neisseria perflava]|uniref:HpaII family restriction endonuclease n=1 Tax=Neisseria perflava TaxID=33053 RepID=UPI0020A21A6D|nr:HpaII family restriction endonuclease [Neisseria perflava]MCP1660935.1 type II restriction enzyme [Neisseria perflava]MCP1771225.1 type II restriction enzyme [Neisseria perflava]
MAEVFSGNKGEWSEPYVLLKLLADGKLYLGDGRMNKIEGIMLPIINILREEQDGFRKYGYTGDKQRVVFDFGNPEALHAVEIKEFKKHAELLLQGIRSRGGKKDGATFTIPDIEEFLRQIGCTRLSARSLSKSDIHIVVHDIRTGICPTLGFSIKSELGSKATLLNASGATNFIYEIKNCDNTIVHHVNSLYNTKGSKDIRARMATLTQAGCQLEFQSVSSTIFSNNLILIDSKLPEILAEMLCQYYSGTAVQTEDLAAEVCSKNPNGYDYSNEHRFYSYKIKRLLCEAALGMRPAEIWHGKYDASGGYLVVRKDGEIVCYHLYSHNQFEDYLFLNTKFDTPSSSRHGFGNVYEQDGKFFFKLNLQIRFS